MTLDELQIKLATMLGTGKSIALDRGDIGLPDLPEFLWPAADGLLLTEAEYERSSQGEIKIAGRTDLPLIGKAAMTVFVAAGPVNLSVQAGLQLESAAALHEIVAEAIPGFSFANVILEAIDISKINWRVVEANSLEVGMSCTCRYATVIAGVTLATEIETAAMTLNAGELNLAASGKLHLDKLEGSIVLEYIDGKVTTSAQIPDLSLEGLASVLGLKMPSIPGFELVDGLLERMEIQFPDDSPMLLFATATELGSVNCLLLHQDGEWCLVAGLHSPGTKFGSLNPILSPLDVFAEVVSFADPVVTYANRPLLAVPYLMPSGIWSTQSFDEGVKVNGTLQFNALGLDFLRAVFGMPNLPLSIPVESDWSQVRLSATLARPLQVLGDLLVVENLALSLTPEPLAIQASGKVSVTVFGAPLPKFTLGASLTATTTSVLMLAEDVWDELPGIPLKVKKVGLQVSTPGKYGILGEISISDKALSVAAEFIGQAPTFLAGSLQGELPLADVLLELVGVDLLPDFIQPTIKDFDLYVVLDPAGTVVVGRFYPFGLSLRGTLTIFGLGFTTDIHLSKNQLRASGELNRAIDLAPVFRLSGVDGGTPKLAIDTAGTPIASMDCNIMLLGVEQNVLAMLGHDGFSCAIQQSLGLSSAQLDVKFGSGMLVADGGVTCMVIGKIGPIRLFQGGPDLGTINIDTGAQLVANIRVEERGSHSAKVEGKIVIADIEVNLPTFDVSITSLDELPTEVLRYIRDHVAELLADLLSDLQAWLRAVAVKVIEAVEDVARALAEHFQQSAKQVADAMLNRLGETLDLTAKGLQRLGKSAEEIGRIFGELGRGTEEIARALEVIGAAPEVIGNVLRELGNGAEEVGRILNQLGYADNVVNGVLHVVFPGIPGIDWPPHVKVPHLKHIKVPHLKHIKVPHLKHIKAPHIKLF